jgi:ParB/RepB/Spo0J family partition protein
MAQHVRLIEPSKIDRNDDNPRLIFRQEELEALEKSIREQGILVPLTVYENGRRFKLLDGERRWRCAQRIGLGSVPAIVQPKPPRLQNLMMMFAIHNARKDWDPLPTALKLAELEELFKKQHGHSPTELELAGIASLLRGEVRRLKKLLSLPMEYRVQLLQELEKPRSQQVLTVDIVLETTKGVESLQKRKVISADAAEKLRRAIIRKFQAGTIDNTVAPRLLARMARAFDRNEVSRDVLVHAMKKLSTDPKYTIADAFAETAEQFDFEYGLEQVTERTLEQINHLKKMHYALSDGLRDALTRLRKELNVLLGGKGN